MAGDGRPLAAPVRTVAAARPGGAPARQAGARPRTVPGRLLETRRGAAPVRRPLMACAGVPRGTRAAVVHRRTRVTGPAGRHVRPPQTDRAGTAGLPRAGIAVAPGPRTTAGFVLRPAVRPAKAPVAARPARARGQRAKGPRPVTAVVTGHHGQPAAGLATPGPVTRAQATAGQAPGTGTGPPVSARTRPRPADMPRPTCPGRRFLIRSAPSSSSRKRGPS